VALVGAVHARLSAGVGPTAQRDGGAEAAADATELPMAGGAMSALSVLLGDSLLWTVLALQALARKPSKPAKGVAAFVLPAAVSQALRELGAAIDAALVPLEAALERWLGASDDTLVAAASACLTAAPPFAAVTQVRRAFRTIIARHCHRLPLLESNTHTSTDSIQRPRRRASAERAGVFGRRSCVLQCVWYGADASKAAATVVPTVVKAHRAALGNLLLVLRKHRLSLQQLKFS
jgi:hypothetical protein